MTTDTLRFPLPPLRHAVGDAGVLVAGVAESHEPFAVELQRRLLQQCHPPPVVLDQVVVGREDVGGFSLKVDGRKRHRHLLEVCGTEVWLGSANYYGKALKGDDRVDGPYPVYGSSGVVGTHEKPLVEGPGIIVGRKGNVGSVYWCAGDYWPIDTVYFVGAEASDLWLYYALRHMHFISTDVAVPGLNRDFVYRRALLIPARRALRGFLDAVTPIHEQMSKLEEMNQELRAARDLLLPRLMSGEVAV